MTRLVFAFLLLATSVTATDRLVFSDLEPHEGFPFAGNTKVVVTHDSVIHIAYKRDPGTEYALSYANGVNAAFAELASWDADQDLNPWAFFAYNDTVYFPMTGTTAVVPIVYKFRWTGSADALVLYDTISSDLSSYGMTFFNTDGTNWAGMFKTNAYQTTTYNWRVATLTNGRIGGLTDWVNGDTLRTAGATVQWRGLGVPLLGGVAWYDQVEDDWSWIEKDGSITKRCLVNAFPGAKNASVAIAGGGSFYDMSITPFDPTGQGDSAWVTFADETTNQVRVFLIRADSAANDIYLADSATVSAIGERSTITDTLAWRTPSITMAGTGGILYYRDWADTTALTTVRIDYHVASNRSNLTTFGAVQFLATDSATSTIGEIQAPWKTVKHNHADSAYAYVVWQRWTTASDLIATYTAIGIPGDGDQQISSSRRRKLLLGGD